MEGVAIGHNLKGTHPGTILARFGLIWFSSFRGEDLNVIFYKNMSNLHNRYTDPSKCINDHTLRSDTEFCQTSLLKLSDKIVRQNPPRSE